MAAATHDELSDMRLGGFATADEGVERIDAMHETGIDQEVERTVDGRRSRLVSLFGEFRQDLVGAYRFVRSPHDLEHPSAYRSQVESALLAKVGGRVESVLYAALVVVRRDV